MATRRRICRIRVLAQNSPVWRIRVLAKMAILASLAGHSTLDTFADIRQTVTRIRHIRTSNLPFRRIWGEWPLLTAESFSSVSKPCLTS
jgi:hypothetical protein